MFVFPKDIRLALFSFVSLWNIEELDFKNVLKKRTQQSVDSNTYLGPILDQIWPIAGFRMTSDHRKVS